MPADVGDVDDRVAVDVLIQRQRGDVRTLVVEAHGAPVTHDRDRVELQACLDLPQPRRCYLCFRWHDSKSR